MKYKNLHKRNTSNIATTAAADHGNRLAPQFRVGLLVKPGQYKPGCRIAGTEGRFIRTYSKPTCHALRTNKKPASIGGGLFY
jgi:hypothetical protein